MSQGHRHTAPILRHHDSSGGSLAAAVLQPLLPQLCTHAMLTSDGNRAPTKAEGCAKLQELFDEFFKQA